jgi:hypothetical protein
MGKKFFIYLAALAATLTVFASPVGLNLMGIDRPAGIHSANQPGGGGGP